MRLATLTLCSILALPSLTLAAPSAQSHPVTKQQCLGYLKDGYEIVAQAVMCQPGVNRDQYGAAFSNIMNTFFSNIMNTFKNNGCENILAEAEANAYVRRETAGSNNIQQYCRDIRPSIQRIIQLYGGQKANQ